MKFVTSICASIRQKIDSVEIKSLTMARLYTTIIPGQCPFERDVYILSWKIAHIPSFCKLNPFYDQLISLRFRALSFLAAYEDSQKPSFVPSSS